ncbi:MAG: type 4a pilus biogenesis protein PilO [Candidatus Wallbacteria bacterium]|nr:type 4a pilus biogenesis protein PilO [Candidatus Wallbacteria bacterium]
MNKNRRDKILLYIIFALIVVVFVQRLFFRPLYKDTVELKSKIMEINAQIANARTKVNSMPELQNELDLLNSHVAEINKSIFAGNEFQLIKKIWEIAGQTNLMIKEMTPVGVSETDISRDSNYSLTFTASYLEFFNFVRFCELLLPVNLQVTDFNLVSSGNRENGQLKIVVKVVKE